MRDLSSEAKANEKQVEVLLEKLSVSNPELVDKLEGRQYSSRGESSGCDNTFFTSEWNSWSDESVR